MTRSWAIGTTIAALCGIVVFAVLLVWLMVWDSAQDDGSDTASPYRHEVLVSYEVASISISWKTNEIQILLMDDKLELRKTVRLPMEDDLKDAVDVFRVKVEQCLAASDLGERKWYKGYKDGKLPFSIVD